MRGWGRLGQAAIGIQESRHGGDVPLPSMGRATDKGHIHILGRASDSRSWMRSRRPSCVPPTQNLGYGFPRCACSHAWGAAASQCPADTTSALGASGGYGRNTKAEEEGGVVVAQA